MYIKAKEGKEMHAWINKHLPGDWWISWDMYWSLVGLLYVCIVAGLYYLIRKMIKNEIVRRRSQLVISILLCLIPVVYCFCTTTKSMFCEYLIISGIAIFSIYKSEYLSFSINEYLCLLGLLIITTSQGYGIIIEIRTLIPLSFLVILIVKSTKHTLRSKWLSVWMCVITICFHIWLIRKIYYALFKELNGYLAFAFGRLVSVRLIFFILVGVIFILFTLCLVYLERKYLKEWYESISKLSIVYPVVDRYFIGALIFDSVLIQVANSAIRMNVFIEDQYEKYLFNMLEWLGTFMVLLQCLFVLLLTQVSEQKIRIHKQELQNENMLTYHRKLEENLVEIRAMKHDLKNIFLTMGEYVDRSDDNEMKDFYQKSIYPLADKEIRMNDCFVALEKIRNNQVKAFLFYKLSYGISCDIDMRLIISTENQNHVDIPEDWEFVEILVRIIGIWLDNAMEECATIKEDGKELAAKCMIRIKQNEQFLQFQIENTVRQNVQLHGIEKGTTTKGIGRGNGLLYAEKMMKKFQNYVWNSYFKDGLFVQSIMFELSTK